MFDNAAIVRPYGKLEWHSRLESWRVNAKLMNMEYQIVENSIVWRIWRAALPNFTLVTAFNNSTCDRLTIDQWENVLGLVVSEWLHRFPQKLMTETHSIRCGNASKHWHYKNARKSTFSFLGMCVCGVPCMVNDVIYANREKTRENRNNNAEEMKAKSRTRHPLSLHFIYRRNAHRLTVSGFFIATPCTARIIRTEWSDVKSEFISVVYH